MAVNVMEKVNSSEDLMDYITNMNRENSVCQVFIPGKGKFTIVLQEEDQSSISIEVKANPELKRMIDESRKEYKQGLGMTTSELLKSLSPKDFV
jgi:adenine specific DNA methylase Mod